MAYKKSPAQLEREIGEILTRSGEQRVIPIPPPSIRTDRQRLNWYWRKFQAAAKHTTAVASSHGVDSRAYRDASAVSDALQREWEWYSSLLQGEEY